MIPPVNPPIATRAVSDRFNQVLAKPAHALAFEGLLDLHVLASLNEVRFKIGPAATRWSQFTRCLEAFLGASREFTYPVHLFRNELPTKRVLQSTDSEYAEFVRHHLDALTTDDPRVAYWFRRQLVIYRASIGVPATLSTPSLVAARSILQSIALGTEPEGPARSEPNSSHKESTMGATFDLYTAESRRRFIFQYWVYDIETDLIAAEGSFIAKGDTVEEATKYLMGGLRARLGDQPNPNLKLHIKLLDKFDKPEKAGPSLTEQFVNAMRDEIQKGGK